MMKDDLHQAIEALEEAAAVLTWPGFAKGAQALRLQVAQKEREACFLLAKKYGDHWTADAILSRMQGSTPHGY